MDDIYARFNPNPFKIAAWNRLLMLGSSSTAVTAKGDPTPQQQQQKPTPDVLYDRAITVLLRLKEDLLRLGWSEVPQERLPPGLLFMIESPMDSSTSTRSTPPRSAGPSRVPPFTGRLLPTPAASPETQPGSSTSAYSSYFDSDVTTSATEMGTEDSSGLTSSPR
ncbi:13034_t:CDS:1, partial [Acaulospora colombiana]